MTANKIIYPIKNEMLEFRVKGKLIYIPSVSKIPKIKRVKICRKVGKYVNPERRTLGLAVSCYDSSSINW